MKHLMKVSILTLTLTLLYSCTPEEHSCDTLYFSSFESQADFENFEGYGYYQGNETPTNGGDNCLVICGGCILPHLYFDIGPFPETMEVSLNFMGKTNLGANMSVHALSDPENQQMISIQDTVWTYYTTEENMILPAEDTLRINFISGGFIPVTTHIDLLTINCEVE